MEVSLVPPSTRIWAEIDTAALQHNMAVIRRQIGSRPRILAVVKANAYGHGIEHVVPAIQSDIDLWGVANVSEAVAIKELESELPVLVLSPCLPAERSTAVACGAIVTISNVEEAEGFSRFARLDRPVSYVLKIDSGMGRIGVPLDQAESVLKKILTLPGLSLHSLATHLPSADEDADFTKKQLEVFHHTITGIRRWLPDVCVQVLNSAGAMGYSSSAYDFIRAGLSIYGVSPLPDQQQDFCQALTWKARVIQVRDVAAGQGISYGRTFITPAPMRIATVSAGYADGFLRQMSGRGAAVLIGGQRCTLLGRVTMDQIMVDVSNVKSVTPGDEVVLLGKQGTDCILASEVAAWAGTIAWDVFTGIGGRTIRFSR